MIPSPRQKPRSALLWEPFASGITLTVSAPHLNAPPTLPATPPHPHLGVPKSLDRSSLNGGEVPVVLPSTARRHHRPGNGRRSQALWMPGGQRAPASSMRGARDPAGRTPRPPEGCHWVLWTQCPSGVQRGTCPGILAAVTWSGDELEGQGACERWNLGAPRLSAHPAPLS